MKKMNLLVVCAGSSVIAITGAAQAVLMLDLRSTDSADPKQVAVPGGTTSFVLHFDIYAVVTGHDTNLTNEGVQDAFFSLVSPNVVAAGLKGNLSLTLAPPFGGVITIGGSTFASGYTGTMQDLDGDGDLDIGSNDSSVPDGWVFARSTTMQTGSDEFLLAHVLFTPTAPFTSGQTNIVLNLRAGRPGIYPAIWQEDGVETDTGGSGTFIAGAPVILTVPEPATLLGAIPIIVRRRRRAGVSGE